MVNRDPPKNNNGQFQKLKHDMCIKETEQGKLIRFDSMPIYWGKFEAVLS
jgi:hypothetical protein